MLRFKCAVDFLVILITRANLIRRVTVLIDVLQKSSQKSCRLNFYSIEDKEIRLETQYLAISSIPFFLL